MAEYLTIDAAYDDATLTDRYISSVDDDSAPVWTDEHIYELLSDFYVIPKDTPTVEAEPVAYSEWEEVKSGKGIFDYFFRCKKCHKGTPNKAYIIAPDYCPFCGAKMDGGDENE